jgi:YVTN family beta-propeller protein
VTSTNTYSIALGRIVLGLACASLVQLGAAATQAEAQTSSASSKTPSPALLVLNKSEAMLAIVDPLSGKVVGTVPTGDGPHELEASADGKLAFASNYGAQSPGQTLSVIDLTTQKELHRVDLGPLRRPHGLHVSGGKLFFTAEANRLIGRYDPATNQVDWLMGTGQTGTHMVLVSPDESKIFTSNIGAGTVSIFERGATPQAWTHTVVQVGKGPEALDLSPDGKTLWSGHSQDGGVSIIDVATKQVTQTLSLGTKRSNRLKFTPDGKLVLVSDLDAGDLLVIDVATKKEIKRLPLGKGLTGILIVPDGSRAYVAASGDNQIAVVDLKTMTVSGHISTGGSPDGMAWVGSR